MPVDRHFGVPVFTRVLDGFAERKEALRRAILDLRETAPSVPRATQGAYHSPGDLHRRQNAHFDWLKRAIVDGCGHELKSVGALPRELALDLFDMWAVVTPRGGWHMPHQHFPSPWSGVFYVDAEHGSSNNTAARAGKLELMNPIPASPAFGLSSSVAYTPRDGALVLFPGALLHYVHPHAHDRERVVVSFNLQFVKNIAQNQGES